jgi:hypothetical protein
VVRFAEDVGRLGSGHSVADGKTTFEVPERWTIPKIVPLSGRSSLWIRRTQERGRYSG